MPIRILVAVDIEGIAGVWRPEQTQAGQADHEPASRWMTDEASAAVRGAFAGGADEVVVNDSHGHFGNLLADRLDPRAQLIQGKPRLLGMMAGVDLGITGVLMIGWHSRAKTGGVLAHTSNSSAFARVWLGGLELGEIGLYAALAGEFGVPVLMASGCDVLAAEVASLLPQARTAVVKWSDGARSGRSLSPHAAGEQIERVAREAVESRLGPRGQGYRAWQPAGSQLRVRCQTPAHADVFSLWPAVRREDAETVSVECASVRDAVRSLNALSAMAAVLR